MGQATGGPLPQERLAEKRLTSGCPASGSGPSRSGPDRFPLPPPPSLRGAVRDVRRSSRWGALLSSGTPTQRRRAVMVQESPSDSARPSAEGRRLGGGAIASLSGLGLLVIFMIQNTQRVRLDFLFWGFIWPLWLLTMASALLGALVWFGLGVMRRHRRRVARREARRG